ncbi:MAG: DUF4340 domain-containing protein [Betaproteobacteria bacterium]|nr:MAG: DUF4340 domain-containing protein [Betaproteobacteria bacterium]
MSARGLLNLGLLLAVVLAGAALYFKPRQAAQESYRLVPVASDELREVVIERRATERIVLARDNGHWRMRTPVAARVDETTLQRLLDVTRLEVSTRLPAHDLTRYELDKPWARVRFGQRVLDFGMTNAVTNELYARSGADVYAIPARYAGAIPSTAAKLLAHRMFAADEVPQGFRLERFSLRHDGVRWQLEPPDPRLSQDDLVRWVDQWRLASSITTQPAEKAAAHSKIWVELKAGRSVSFSVIARTPNLVLQREDEGLDYHFPSRMESLLLTPPNAAGANQR